MGGALLRGWQERKINDNIIIYDPLARHGDPQFYGTELFNKLGDFIKSAIRADTFVMAVKPQIMDDVCLSIIPGVSKKALIISIAAGQTIDSFKQRFPEGQPVIRAMPNTPASIGKGMTVLAASESCSESQKEKAEKLLSAVGLVEWAGDEKIMDAVTAISGSGPAYVFYLAEVLAEAGIRAGLDREMALRLARQTIIGSGALAENQKNVDIRELRSDVTSPGGTTEAALEVLMSGKLQEIFDKAVAAAIERGHELR
jgi:pyrroline-5-carboxylate reductase